jgi:hypothetical protein
MGSERLSGVHFMNSIIQYALDYYCRQVKKGFTPGHIRLTEEQWKLLMEEQEELNLVTEKAGFHNNEKELLGMKVTLV